mmetsp:Transcript_66374/g.205863  ORF Transcript_66374/g.205863 Transcript_66374/m.205863 type:complete len:186 (-) Transcript_66374:51-608(-)
MRAAAAEGLSLGDRLEVYVLSLQDLPHRQGSGDLWRRDVFAVRARWPSHPHLPEAEAAGLQAYEWDSKRRHSTYVYVDRALHLPLLQGQRSVTLAVHEQDLVQERLVGEVEVLLRDCDGGKLRSYCIYGPDGQVEGSVHLAVRERRDGRTGLDDFQRPLAPRRRSAWWSPFCLCSTHERGFVEVC